MTVLFGAEIDFLQSFFALADIGLQVCGLRNSYINEHFGLGLFFSYLILNLEY